MTCAVRTLMYNNGSMIIKSFALPEPMIEGLKKESDVTGLPVSEIVRRAIDNYLEGKRGEIIYQFNGDSIQPPYVLTVSTGNTDKDILIRNDEWRLVGTSTGDII